MDQFQDLVRDWVMNVYAKEFFFDNPSLLEGVDKIPKHGPSLMVMNHGIPVFDIPLGLRQIERTSGRPVHYLIDTALTTKAPIIGGIIGAGEQAELQARWTARLLGIRKIVIWARRPEKAKALAARLNEKEFEASSTASIPALLEDCNLAITTTPAAEPLVIHEGDKLFAWVYLDPANPPEVVQLQFNNSDWNHRARWGANKAHAPNLSGAGNHEAGPLPPLGEWVKLEVDAATVGLAPGDRVNGWAFTQFGGSVYYDHAGVTTMHPPDDRYKVSRVVWETQAKDDAAVPEAIRALIAVPVAERTPEQDRQVLDYYLRHAHEATRESLAPLEAERAQLIAQAEQLEAMAPQTLVAKEMPNPRPVYVLNRGEYDQPITTDPATGEDLQPLPRDTPAALPPMPEGAPANRLGLAQWLTDPGHPLTARVTVNRIWQHYYGTGLVETAEDFGSQGAWPSHPELLDWLAVEFVESGWDVKHLHRLIVTSAAYRQSSRVTPELLERDPNNRLITRGPRFRLEAEVVRDQALFVSGLLVEQVGGPSVKPYQPAGLWFAVGYSGSNTVRFVRGDGDDLYRRSMYTFWKRTSPPPSLSMFDAPSRESCTVRRSRTNTPLQALVTLNDIQYVEAARVMAQRAIHEGGDNAAAQIAYAFKLAAGRDAGARELAVLQSIYDEQLAVYEADPDAAAALIAVGEAPPDDALAPIELAAMTIVTNTLLNLDEVLTQH